jgi:prepilin signal peptidase PulO-like enzyme (type II secretory pathway)
VGRVLLVNLNGTFVPLRDAVIGAAAGYLVLWAVYWLFKLATGKEGMGYGDFKLLAALGAWLGWAMLPTIILLSSVVGRDGRHQPDRVRQAAAATSRSRSDRIWPPPA